MLWSFQKVCLQSPSSPSSSTSTLSSSITNSSKSAIYPKPKIGVFPQPHTVILPHSASTLSLHPLVATNDWDCSGPEQQKLPTTHILKTSQLKFGTILEVWPEGWISFFFDMQFEYEGFPPWSYCAIDLFQLSIKVDGKSQEKWFCSSWSSYQLSQSGTCHGEILREFD